jgi:hypothetical protein
MLFFFLSWEQQIEIILKIKKGHKICHKEHKLILSSHLQAIQDACISETYEHQSKAKKFNRTQTKHHSTTSTGTAKMRLTNSSKGYYARHINKIYTKFYNSIYIYILRPKI